MKTNLILIAEKRMWTIFVLLFYMLFDLILIFGLFLNWDIVMFWVMFFISIFLFPMLIHKIFSPKKIILYDTKNKVFIINKMFKTIKIQLEDIVNYDANYRSNAIVIRTRYKKRIYLIGIKKIENVIKELNKKLKRNYSWFW